MKNKKVIKVIKIYQHVPNCGMVLIETYIRGTYLWKVVHEKKVSKLEDGDVDMSPTAGWY